MAVTDFMCRGEKHHILPYHKPDGMSIEDFTQIATCTECGAKIDHVADNPENS